MTKVKQLTAGNLEKSINENLEKTNNKMKAKVKNKDVVQNNDCIARVGKSTKTIPMEKIKVESIGEIFDIGEIETAFAKLQGLHTIKHFVNLESGSKSRPHFCSCVVAVVVNETVLFGVSKISLKEKSYRKKLGVTIAKGRAYKTPSKTIKITDPFKVNERFLNDLIKQHFKSCYDVTRAIVNQEDIKNDIKSETNLRQQKEAMVAKLKKMNVKHKDDVLDIFKELKKIVNAK